MSERPDLIFGVFLALAGVAAAALLIGLAEAGAGGAAGFAAVSAGLVSACVRFAIELRDLPPALVLLSVTAVASATALLRALCSVWREQRSIQALAVIPLTESEYRDTLPVPRDVEVGVLRSRRQGAFCAGLLRPRVVMTTALLDALDPAERRAVVEHELSHARAGAPLKLMLGHVAARTFFWVPALRDLADRHVLLTELEADRAAIAATSRSALAGALSEALEAPAIVVSAGLADHAAARIDRLFDAHAKLPRLITPARAACTLFAVATVAAMAYSSPRLSSNQSAQLHAMSINLLAHHLQARVLGLAATVVAITLLVVARRGLPARPGRARAVAVIQRALR